MLDIIIGNICSIGAMLCDSFSGTRKNRKEMLIAQSISQLFYIGSSLILKGYSATVQNVVAICRNIFAAYDKDSKYIQWLCTIAPVILGIYFNNRGLLGYIPIVSNLLYTISLFVYAKQPRKLKYSFIIMNMCFSVFNFAIMNFVSAVACIVVSITTIISLYKEKKK